MTRSEAFEARLEREKAASFGQALIKAARLFDEQARARLQSDPRYREVKAHHRHILPHLDLEGTRVTVLAERMEMTKQGAGQIVDELEALGLVERAPDPSDGRAKLVRFTARGRAALFDGLAVLRVLEAELAEALGQGELTRLRGGLAKVIGRLEGGSP